MISTIAAKRDAPPQTARWVLLFIVAVVIHAAPLLVMTLPAPKSFDEPLTMAVNFDEEAIEALLASAPEPKAEKEALKNAAPGAAVKSAAAPPTPAAVQPPVPQALPKKEEPPKAASEVEPQPEKRPIPLDLEPFKPEMAFDESKTTKEEPKGDAYLSDRTSTAADRGPKDLPRGDPYVDKGESVNVRLMQKRGEGNLPAIPSDANSGSVKKEGSPDAGKGPQDKERLPDREAPLAPPALKAPKEEKGLAPVTEAARPSGVKETPPAAPAPKRPDAEKTEALALKPEKGGGEAERPKAKPVAPAPKDDARGPLPGKTEPQPEVLTPRDGEKTAGEQKRPSEEAPSVTAPKKPEPNELDAFKALLDGTGKTDGRGGNAGEKTGINAREGSKGHEGDGSLRPGHDEAVSDVTTVNLESSAAEFDEARFAKRTDEKSKYFKAAFRRIDAKWKAEIAARSRFRFERGVVSMKIVISREGKLLEASEVQRTKGLGDEYVSIAKKAIQLGCDPSADPFPEALQKHEKLECVVNFLY